MSVYRVVIDGVDIYDPTRKELTLINPVLTVEMGSAGNFEFTIPPTHIFYNNITPYGSNIDVYEDGMLIWSGRPLNPVKDFWNQKRFHCEGCLAYLNDTIQTARDITGTTADYLRSFIAIHNSQESRNDRKFVVRNIAHDYVNSNRTIELNLESTFEAIRKYTIGVEGGYLFATKSSEGMIYLDWYDTAPYTCNQKIQFAINMVDITRTDDYEEFFTGVYAIGGQDPDTKQTISLSNVLWASNELRQKYGDIVKRVQFKDCITTNALYVAAQDYLNKHIVPDYIIEAEAADLHFLEGQHERFEVGTMVQVLSEPHLINGMYPLSRIVCYLDTGRKVITLGTLKRQTLTALQEKIDNRLDDSDIPGDPHKPPEKRDPPDDPFGDYDGWQRNEPGDPWHPVIDGVPSELDENGNYQPVPNEYPYITGGDGNDYVMGVDPSGGPGGSPAVTFDKVLNYIKISTTHEGVYHENDSFDLSEYTVAGYYGDGTSIDVTSRCEYAPTNGQTLLFMNGQPVFKWLVARLTDYGRQFMDRMDLPYSDKIPASIHIVILPVKLEYEDGETIDYSGIAVELRDEDGNLFTDAKYPDGFIPFNELEFPVTTASLDGKESDGKTSDIIIDGETPTFYGGRKPFSAEFFEKVQISSEYIREITYLHQTNTLLIATFYDDDGSSQYAYGIIASETATSGHYGYAMKNVLLDAETGEKISEDTTVIDSHDIPISETYTHNGKTVYYGMVGVSASSRLIYLSTSDNYGYDITYLQTNKKYIAWIMLYGDVVSEEGEQELPVNWKELSDKFKITVTKGIE